MDHPRRHLLQRSGALGALALWLPAATARAADPAGDILFAQPGAFIPVTGTQQRFQVRRIYCVGRNYAAHAIERGSDPTREPPFFFQKPTDAIQTVAQGVTVDHPYPPVTKNYHYLAAAAARFRSSARGTPSTRTRSGST